MSETLLWGEFEANNVTVPNIRAIRDDAARLVKTGASASPMGLSMTKLPRIKPGFAYSAGAFLWRQNSK
jgi:hypothetical protein